MDTLNSLFINGRRKYDLRNYDLSGQSNIAGLGKYGTDQSRDLLYCHNCSIRFASIQAKRSVRPKSVIKVD